MPSSPNPRRDALWLVPAVAAPPVLAAALVPFRESFANTDAALLLVLLVVAVAAGSGRRLPGVVTALSAGLWFDVLLTRPYQRLSIENRSDVETAVLLLLVGVAVSELADWGRRQQASAGRQAAYVAGIQGAMEAIARASSPDAVVGSACEQLTHLLGLRRCRFDAELAAGRGGHPRLRPDGQVEVDGGVCDIEHFGLPTTRDIDLPVVGERGHRGCFVLSAATGARPSLAQRLAAVALADQVAAALDGARPSEPPAHASTK